MNPKTSAVVSTTMGEKPILCDTKSSSGDMDCNWNGANRDQISARSKPMSDTLSKLAQLLTCMEYKPKSQRSSSICKETSDPNAPANLEKKEQALQKLHRCHPCGKKFALLSSLQLHKCPRQSSNKTETSDPFYHDAGPYACAPCGQAFSHKQELLYHQQAGVCQPQTTKPQTSPQSTCDLCSRTFRTSAGLACHVRLSHQQIKTKKKKTVVVVNSMRRKKKVLLSSGLFQCRSCDKSFPKTSLLHRHRREEHRRDVKLSPLKHTGGKITRQRRKGETYPCLHCGKEFLHHLTRWAHFRHYSSHHQTHLKLSSKINKKVELKPIQSHPPRPRGRPRKHPLPVKAVEEEEETDTAEESDVQYPCTSCERIFSSKSGLFAHEKVHEELPEEEEEEVVETRRCCSVCKDGIEEEIQDGCEAGVFHCVPCAKAFVALDAFLEHCRKHLIQDREEEFSDD